MKTALAAGVAAPAVNLAFAPSLFGATSGDPIILGHQCDLTGGISSWGYWLNKAAEEACRHLNENDGIAGRPVKLVTEDTETNPPTGARKFRALVQRHKADFVLGSVHSGINLATVPIAKELKTVYIPNGMAAEMTGKKGNRYTFRIGADTYSQAAAGRSGRPTTWATSGRSSSPTTAGAGATSTNTSPSWRSWAPR